jgi:hypothetical protein
MAGQTIAGAACLTHIPYLTALDIWKKFKKMGSTYNLP